MSFNPKPLKILNDPPGGKKSFTTAACTQKDHVTGLVNGEEVSKNLQKLMLRVEGEFMDSGKGIKYKELSNSPFMQQYRDMASKLRGVDLGGMNEAERKAFFINVYNALTIQGVLEMGLPDSVLKIEQFWRVTCYRLGPYVFSLDDMEHGVLRGNRPHPASQELPFGLDDERVRFTLTLDPRVHFALNCGAKSCPAIRVYSAENLERGLEMASQAFCQDEIKVKPKQRRIWVSKLFQWYQTDFGDNDYAAIRWAIPYVAEETRYGLQELLNFSSTDGPIDIVYSDYNWKLNKL